MGYDMGIECETQKEYNLSYRFYTTYFQSKKSILGVNLANAVQKVVSGVLKNLDKCAYFKFIRTATLGFSGVIIAILGNLVVAGVTIAILGNLFVCEKKFKYKYIVLSLQHVTTFCNDNMSPHFVMTKCHHIL
jgi:hypothetical protein